MFDFDMAVDNAVIVDGTGADRFTGSLIVNDGEIIDIYEGESRGEAVKNRIDAKGMVVAPGFIDPHTHYDAQVAWDPLLTSSPWHGVTTVVQGNCGVGVAPLSAEMRELATWDLVHVEGIPYKTLKEGLKWEWETFGEYLDTMQKRGVGINVAALVPLSPVRQTAIGLECLERAGTDQEIERMKDVYRKSLREGGFGLSMTFFDGHVGYKGRPVACRLTDRRELEALFGVMKEEEIGTLEIAFNLPELGDIEDESLEMLEFASEKSGRRITYLAIINHHNNPKSYLKAAKKLEKLMKDGKVLPQFPVKPVSQNFNLKSPQALGYCNCVHQVFDRSRKEQIKIYSDPEFRAKLQSELDTNEFSDRFFDRLQFLDGKSKKIKQLASSGKTVAEIASDMNITKIDCFLDLAIEDHLETEFTFHAVGFDEEGTLNLINDGRFMPGLSDGGAHVDVLNDTGYATHFLGHWVREKKALRLEEAVRMLSSMPADHFGIARRGRIKKGNHADLVIFDPETVINEVPEYVTDMPASGRRLVTRAKGIHMTIVNGQVLYKNGEHQGVYPGRMLRSYDA